MPATNRFTKIARPRVGMPYHETVQQGTRWAMKCPLCGFLTRARRLGEKVLASAATVAHIETHYGPEEVDTRPLRTFLVVGVSGPGAAVEAQSPEKAAVAFARTRLAVLIDPETRVTAYIPFDSKDDQYLFNANPGATPWIVEVGGERAGVVFVTDKA